MSNFHSSVSRREFMQGLGIGAAGIGVARLTAPVFHDLDEMMSSKDATGKRPWFVKTRDFKNPTVEVDFSMMNGSFDQRLEAHHTHTHALYIGYQAMAALTALDKRNKEELAAMQANQPGYQHATYALNAANPGSSTTAWAGTLKVKSPAELGVPVWQGSPEENSKLLRAAFRLWGASQIGITAIDSDIKKAFFSYMKTASENYLGDSPAWPPPLTVSRKFLWTDQDKGYEDSTTTALPGNKQMYMVGIVTPMSKELWRRSPSLFKNIANGTRSLRNTPLHQGPQGFLQGLGYMGYTHMNDGSDPIASNAATILGGCTEIARQDNFCFTPEDGSAVGLFVFFTDIPLAPDKPIDAGMFKFCATCGKCAEFCPSNSISKAKEPQWEVPLRNNTSFDWAKVDPTSTYMKQPRVYHFAGKKQYFCDGDTCHLWYAYTAGGCGICYGTCSFNVNTDALVHSLSKPLIANTSVFNHFLYSISKNFGYGVMPADEMESWWDLSLPALGSDTSVEAWSGGYK